MEIEVFPKKHLHYTILFTKLTKQSSCSHGAYTLVEETDSAQSIQMCWVMRYAKNKAEK